MATKQKRISKELSAVSPDESLPHQQSSIAHFEENLERLEAIADSLDSGDVPLSAMIELYEEGMKLIHESRTMLTGADLKITALQQSFQSSQQ